MKRSHQIIFALIALLAVATLLLGLLQFLTMSHETAPSSGAHSNSVAGPPAH